MAMVIVWVLGLHGVKAFSVHTKLLGNIKLWSSRVPYPVPTVHHTQLGTNVSKGQSGRLLCIYRRPTQSVIFFGSRNVRKHTVPHHLLWTNARNRSTPVGGQSLITVHSWMMQTISKFLVLSVRHCRLHDNIAVCWTHPPRCTLIAHKSIERIEMCPVRVAENIATRDKYCTLGLCHVSVLTWIYMNDGYALWQPRKLECEKLTPTSLAVGRSRDQECSFHTSATITAFYLLYW